MRTEMNAAIASKQANSGCMDFMDQVARISNRMY